MRGEQPAPAAGEDGSRDRVHREELVAPAAQDHAEVVRGVGHEPVRVDQHEARRRPGTGREHLQGVVRVRVAVHHDQPVGPGRGPPPIGAAQGDGHDPLRARPIELLPQPADQAGQHLRLVRHRRVVGAGHLPGAGQQAGEQRQLPLDRQAEPAHRRAEGLEQQRAALEVVREQHRVARALRRGERAHLPGGVQVGVGRRELQDDVAAIGRTRPRDVRRRAARQRRAHPDRPPPLQVGDEPVHPRQPGGPRGAEAGDPLLDEKGDPHVGHGARGLSRARARPGA